MLDEIYTYVGRKADKHYIFTAYGITDMGYAVRFAEVFPGLGSYNLRRFLAKIPKAQYYFSDGAPMYGGVLRTQVLQEKNAATNLVESFNSQLRQYVTALRRKTKAYAKTTDSLARQIALITLSQGWLAPTKISQKSGG